MASVRLTRRALADLRAIRAHIAERDPAAAARVVSAIEHSLSLLGDQPFMGPAVHTGWFHVVPRYRYVIAYRVRGDTVEVRFIFHPAQDR